MDKSVTRTCVVCGVCIDGYHPRAKVCSAACRIERRRESKRIYAEDNREKLLAARRRHYAANPEKYREYARHYREDNPEKCREYARRYYVANKEKVLKTCRKYQAEKMTALQVLRDMNLI